jgi:regulator of protease activity HflC (stomatin/prohibitin superfamily)
MPAASHAATTEKIVKTASGWPMLLLDIALFFAAPLSLLLLGSIDLNQVPSVLRVVFLAVGLLLLALFIAFGFFTLQPNEARVLILFGHYRGTARDSGFHWANPFYAHSRGLVPTKPGAAPTQNFAPRSGLRIGRLQALASGMAQTLSTKLSLRAVNFNTDTLKVNDKRGNPIEIGAVIVWRIHNTAQAAFDVEDYRTYVEMQSESAIRSIASRYAYDHGDEHERELTLRGAADEVAGALRDELQARLAKAGVLIEEARLTHLAYAPEIAPVMLRRQQAEAIISARQIIVHNAVGMVQMALEELDKKNVVKLDDERRAAMVSNLLVVLCGQNDPSPVINTGTLYT